MNNIILIGFMGCGKTSVGIRLSYCMKKAMIDTDKEIEKHNKITISEIFDRYGEDSFRQMETECLSRLLQEADSRIISVGGGLPMKEENRVLLKKLGFVVYLKVSAKTVCERLKGDTTRPLLHGGDPEEKVALLLKKRSPVYESAADMVINTDGKSFDEIIKEITTGVEENSTNSQTEKGAGL